MLEGEKTTGKESFVELGKEVKVKESCYGPGVAQRFPAI